MRQSGGCSRDQERQKKSILCERHNQQGQEKCKVPETAKETEVGRRTPSIRNKGKMKLPNDLLDLLLTFHMPVCAEEFIGNPRYVLYWCYDKSALKEILGMTKDQFRIVQSSLGQFMRRVPKTAHWLSRLKGVSGFTAYSSWAITPPERTPPSTPPSVRDRSRQARSRTAPGGLRPSGAVARPPICRKSYVSLDSSIMKDNIRPPSD